MLSQPKMRAAFSMPEISFEGFVIRIFVTSGLHASQRDVIS